MPKLKMKTIRTLKEYISLVEELRTNCNSPLWYRGCGEERYELKPSLYRHKRSKTIEDFMRMEKLLLARFQQRSIPFHARSLGGDPWEWIFLMQHYGVPTRLLDWSESPLMALFFAVTSAKHSLNSRGGTVFKSDASVWILQPEQWNIRSVDLKSFTGAVLTTDEANAGAYKPTGDINTMKSFPIAIYGAHNSQRIVAQRGVFVCFGKDSRPMEIMYENESFIDDCLIKLLIRKDVLPDMYEALRRHGITDSVVFPDLDGLSREIRREYSFEV
jgi:hypothetical protein